MSSPLTHATLLGLFTAPLVGLAVLAVLARPVTPPATPAAVPTLPSVGVWRVICPPDGWGWGPFTSPDACRNRLETTMRTCNRPILDGQPNPDFVQIAGLCRDAYNATQCRCEYQLAVAQAPLPTRPPTATEAMFGAQ